MKRGFFEYYLLFVLILVSQSCDTKLDDVEDKLGSNSEISESIKGPNLDSPKPLIQIDSMGIEDTNTKRTSSIKFYWDEQNNLKSFRTRRVDPETGKIRSFLCKLYYKSIGSGGSKLGGVNVIELLPDQDFRCFKFYPVVQYNSELCSYVFFDPLFSRYNLKAFKANKFKTNQLSSARYSRGLLKGNDEL